MLTYLYRILLVLGLILAGVIWLIEDWIAKLFGKKLKYNCFTWAVNNFDYFGGDGILFHKSVSGDFPHISVVKNASTRERTELTLEEYIPIIRVPKKLPPRRFDGVVRTTLLKATEAKKNPE